MSLIISEIELKCLELFALEFGKIAEPDFVYTLSSTNVDQLVPNMVTIYTDRKNLTGFLYLWFSSINQCH